MRKYRAKNYKENSVRKQRAQKKVCKQRAKLACDNSKDAKETAGAVGNAFSRLDYALHLSACLD